MVMDLEIKPEELNRLLMCPADGPMMKSQKRKMTLHHLGKKKRVKTDDEVITTNKSGKSNQEGSHTFTSSETAFEVDPKIAEEIVKRIEQKNMRTLCLSGLPPKTSLHTLNQLIPETHTARIQWNTLAHKCTGTVHVEFESVDMVKQYKEKLDGMIFKDKTISAKTGNFLPECADRYDCRTLVLHGLHYRTHIGEIAKRFPSTTSIKLTSELKSSDRQRPILAFLTFPAPQDALLAFDTRQSCTIRRRRFNVTWFLKRNEEQQPVRKCLFVRGLKKSVTETDLQTVFPQASFLSMRPKSGEAYLHYDLEEDCVLDWQNARHLQLFGRKIQVAFHNSIKKPTTSSVLNSESSLITKDMKKRPKTHGYRTNTSTKPVNKKRNMHRSKSSLSSMPPIVYGKQTKRKTNQNIPVTSQSGNC